MTDSYLRFPHLREDLVTFVAEDDVWLAPLAGGRAWRLSADRAPAQHPRFSPDGTMIAWASVRDGAPEVYVGPADGGPSTRLTYWGASTTDVLGWTPDGAVLAKTSAGHPSGSQTWAHAVPAAGGPAEQLPYGPVGELAFGPGGAVLLSSSAFKEPAHWKRYRGGTAGKLWLDRTGDGEFTRILAELESGLECPMWVGGRMAFVSDHEGVAGIYSLLPDGTDLRGHGRSDFYVRHASTDGARIVYESAGRLWLLADLAAGTEPALLDVRLGSTAQGRQPYPIDTANHLGVVAPDHTGRGSAVEVRGTVHWLTHSEGPARTLAGEPGVRARSPIVLGQSGNVAWVTDADGEDAVQVAPADGSEPGVPPRRIGGGVLGRVLELVAAPDGTHIAVVSHDGRLSLIDTDSAEIREVVRSEEGEPRAPAFSPDSTWLAWSHPGPDPLRQIKLASVTDLVVTDVTDLRFSDYEPVFAKDGRYLAFLSVRTFDPVYDVHVFDISFPRGCRPYLVPLSADALSPFDPQSAGRPPVRSGPDTAKGDETPTPATVVDLEGISERLVPFPVDPANYSGLRAAEDALIWLSHPLAGVLSGEDARPDSKPSRPSLERYDMTRLRLDRVESDVDSAVVSGDGKRIVIRDGDALRVVPAARRSSSDDDDDEDQVKVDLDRIRVTVDPAAEWRQAFDETGRLMRDHYWRADMDGTDWAEQLRRYRPIVEQVAGQDDFVDLLWEIQGELGTSHCYVMPRHTEQGIQRSVGKLGADLARDADGLWRVTRVLPGESSDPKARSPLRALGARIREGAAIVAVDSRAVDAEFGPAPLLAGTAGKPVELTVAPAEGGAQRRVVVTPLDDDTPLRYQDWVASRREYVHTTSDGRLGYLHVPDMVATGWAQLHRDLRLEVRREGLIVDVRQNSGGHLSQLVIERLARTVTGWDVARDGYEIETYPKDSPRGPIVAVADEFAGSDGDIVNAVIKARGIGPVVGTRTWGGTIGIDMRYRLVDGTMVTQPRYATWLSGPGWGVENHGVDPDVEVVMTPQDWVNGRDPQLDRAVEIALRTLTEHPAATPPSLPPPKSR
ncbi:MAG TPA: PDZ domain-containing protein [Pseudonocardiaceae bacterium]|nr:PDZ domain-containing protein [Pseudonocardiaceae bacterium]